MTRKQIYSRQALQDWLAKVGLEGNPFEEGNAYDEVDSLPEYFLDVGIFDAIAGRPSNPEFQIVFAPRGSGKSAHSVMLSRKCKPYAKENASDLSQVLVIPHNQFTSLIETYQIHRRITGSQHLQEILKYGAQNLLDTIIGDDYRAKLFSHARLGRFRWFCDKFFPDLLESDSLNRYFAKLLPRVTFKWKEFERAIAQKKCGTLLHSRTADPAALFLARLVDAPGRPMSSATTAPELMAEFVSLAHSAGLEAVYVLVDQVDATAEAERDPHFVVDLIQPLLEQRSLMQGKGWAFKIFLPTDTRDWLCQPGTRLTDFVHRHEVQIQWDEDLLRELLAVRLKYFSHDHYESIDELCAGFIERDEARQTDRMVARQSKKTKTTEEDLIAMSNGSPRRLLQLGNYLFQARAMRTNGDLFLTGTDWNTAFERDHKELGLGEIKLCLDPGKRSVIVGARSVKLTKKEFSFLECLVVNQGLCSREQLVKYVWGPEAPETIPHNIRIL